MRRFVALVCLLSVIFLAAPEVSASTIYTYALDFDAWNDEVSDGTGALQGVDRVNGTIAFKIARRTTFPRSNFVGRSAYYELGDVQLTLIADNGYTYSSWGGSATMFLKNDGEYDWQEGTPKRPYDYLEDTVEFNAPALWFQHDWYGNRIFPPSVVTGRGSFTQRFTGITASEAGSGGDIETPEGSLSVRIRRMELVSVAVPEPSLPLLLGAAAGYVALRRRRSDG